MGNSHFCLKMLVVVRDIFHTLHKRLMLAMKNISLEKLKSVDSNISNTQIRDSMDFVKIVRIVRGGNSTDFVEQFGLTRRCTR